MGLEFCSRCGDSVVRKGCRNENCEEMGAMVIPNNVNHMETSILAHFNYTASKGTNPGTRWIAIDRAYHARFGNHSGALNWGYLESLGDGSTDTRATRLIEILRGLNVLRKDSAEVYGNREEDISHIKKKYL